MSKRILVLLCVLAMCVTTVLLALIVAGDVDRAIGITPPLAGGLALLALGLLALERG